MRTKSVRTIRASKQGDSERGERERGEEGEKREKITNPNSSLSPKSLPRNLGFSSPKSEMVSFCTNLRFMIDCFFFVRFVDTVTDLYFVKSRMEILLFSCRASVRI